MKNLFLLLSVLVISNNLVAQNSKHQPDFSGHWVGILRQDDSGLTNEYVFSISLSQDNKAQLYGTSKIEVNAQGEYGVLTLKGTANGKGVEIVEGKIIEQKIRNYAYWCIKSYNLSYNSQKETLTGRWFASASCQGSMVLRRKLAKNKTQNNQTTTKRTTKPTNKDSVSQNMQAMPNPINNQLPEGYLNMQTMQKALNNKEVLTGKKIILENVYFQQGTSNLLATSYQSLQKVVELLKNNSNLQIKLSGHTDNVGKEALNLRLSKLRAVAVMNYLINKGIAENRLSAEGNGSLFPIQPNDSEENKQKNRRVEFEIL